VKKKKPARPYFRDEKSLKKIGKKMRDYRLQQDISIETLANESEVSYTQLAKMERGEVNFSISYFIRIAEVLKIDPKELLPD
jgi:transcriptional regulator with XRE-family HTH domain